MTYKKLLLKWIIWAAVFLWMVFIFYLSAQTAKDSSELSGILIRKLAEFLRSDFHSLAPAKQVQFIADLQHVARKAAHALLYMVLGILCMTAFSFKHQRWYLAIIPAALVCAGYAATDEVHQLFVPGRSGELGDVAIDFCGSLAGIFLVVLVNSVVRGRLTTSEHE